MKINNLGIMLVLLFLANAIQADSAKLKAFFDGEIQAHLFCQDTEIQLTMSPSASTENQFSGSVQASLFRAGDKKPNKGPGSLRGVYDALEQSFSMELKIPAFQKTYFIDGIVDLEKEQLAAYVDGHIREGECSMLFGSKNGQDIKSLASKINLKKFKPARKLPKPPRQCSNAMTAWIDDYGKLRETIVNTPNGGWSGLTIYGKFREASSENAILASSEMLSDKYFKKHFGESLFSMKEKQLAKIAVEAARPCQAAFNSKYNSRADRTVLWPLTVIHNNPSPRARLAIYEAAKKTTTNWEQQVLMNLAEIGSLEKTARENLLKLGFRFTLTNFPYDGSNISSMLGEAQGSVVDNRHKKKAQQYMSNAKPSMMELANAAFDLNPNQGAGGHALVSSEVQESAWQDFLVYFNQHAARAAQEQLENPNQNFFTAELARFNGRLAQSLTYLNEPLKSDLTQKFKAMREQELEIYRRDIQARMDQFKQSRKGDYRDILAVVALEYELENDLSQSIIYLPELRALSDERNALRHSISRTLAPSVADYASTLNTEREIHDAKQKLIHRWDTNEDFANQISLALGNRIVMLDPQAASSKETYLSIDPHAVELAYFEESKRTKTIYKSRAYWRSIVGEVRQDTTFISKVFGFTGDAWRPYLDLIDMFRGRYDLKTDHPVNYPEIMDQTSAIFHGQTRTHKDNLVFISQLFVGYVKSFEYECPETLDKIPHRVTKVFLDDETDQYPPQELASSKVAVHMIPAYQQASFRLDADFDKVLIFMRSLLAREKCSSPILQQLEYNFKSVLLKQESLQASNLGVENYAALSDVPKREKPERFTDACQVYMEFRPGSRQTCNCWESKVSPQLREDEKALALEDFSALMSKITGAKKGERDANRYLMMRHEMTNCTEL